MKCPQCNDDCSRDEVDIGVGVQYGKWQCSSCGWYEGHLIDAIIDAELEGPTIMGDTDTDIRRAEDVDILRRERENGCR